MNEQDHSVSVYSTDTFAPLANFALGPLPHHAEISHDGRTVYVGLFGTNRIATIDTDTEAVREYVSSPNSAARAHAPHPSEDGRFIFVPHEQGTSELTTLDAETGDIVMNVVPGSGPSEVLPARGGKLYVSIRGEGKVKVIDRATGALEWDLAVGTQPEVLMLTPNERTLVVTLRAHPGASGVRRYRYAPVDQDRSARRGRWNRDQWRSRRDVARSTVCLRDVRSRNRLASAASR